MDGDDETDHQKEKMRTKQVLPLAAKGTTMSNKLESETPVEQPRIVRPIRCTRCRTICGEDDRIIRINADRSVGLCCPKCGCSKFYLVRADGKNCGSKDKRAEFWPNKELSD